MHGARTARTGKAFSFPRIYDNDSGEYETFEKPFLETATRLPHSKAGRNRPILRSHLCLTEVPQESL